MGNQLDDRIDKKIWVHFTVLILLFGLNQLLKVVFESAVFIHGYFNDLLAIPLIIAFTSLLLQLFYYQKSENIISLPKIIFTVLLVTVYFEWYLPDQSTSYTRDLWDIVCYIVGGIYSYVWLRPRSNTQPS